MSSDKALAVKGKMISPVTWRNLIGAKEKEKGKGKMGEPTPNMARYHEAIFKKIQRMEHKSIHLYYYNNGRDKANREALSRIVPNDFPAFPLFPNDLFAGDCSLPPTPLSSDTNEPFTPVLEEFES
ncbi:hypothetical protein V6N11_082048 [Hibiscus sabdariffa]|uniref:Uncharacterized protein n=1 Tax=Hibiscus sabdariffa TaxID=183260 RepID=A0ABR2QGU5_9ROSI